MSLILCYSYQDPFEEYQTRQQKRRAKKAEAEGNARAVQPTERKEQVELNWFGEKLGSGKAANGVGAGGIGKYLQLNDAETASKRPASDIATSDGLEEGKKKRKIGFGDFEGW